ncbi:MAG: hypothetical protein HPY50_14440 [Firmicutes bacterium]|nr:hypothetical protein [Bacillota bacterium]
MSKYNWFSLIGDFDIKGETITFKGKNITYLGLDGNEASGSSVGQLISDQYFGSGIITADIEFKKSIEDIAVEIILFYEPINKNFINAGLSSALVCSVRSFINNKWTNYALAGDRSQLKIDQRYLLSVKVKGSKVDLSINGIDVLSTYLPYTLPRGQVGLWCFGRNNIIIRNFKVEYEKPKAFVIMQFSSPYDEIYKSVIEKICDNLGVEVVLANQKFGPGIVINDITKEIIESNIIIADITPDNPNVYYEVGYAHALKKDTILISEEGRKLPFDVSPFRTLFYENTIGGKSKLEEGLEKHIRAIIEREL